MSNTLNEHKGKNGTVTGANAREALSIGVNTRVYEYLKLYIVQPAFGKRARKQKQAI